jgi:MFS family permease
MGGSFSKFFTYPQIFSILCPIIGALIIAYFNFQVLFVTALLFVLLASIPLLPLRSEKTNFIFTWDSVKDIWSKNKRFFLPEIIDNFMEDAGVVLTIFIYIKLLSITQIGIIGTLTSIVAIIFTLTIGKLTDKWNKYKLLRIGAMFVTFAWVSNFLIGQFMPSAWLFYIATIILALSLKVFLVPYQSILFNSARKDDAQFLVLREVPNILGRLIMYTLAIFLYDELPILFLIVGILFVYFWFLDSRKLIISEGIV